MQLLLELSGAPVAWPLGQLSFRRLAVIALSCRRTQAGTVCSFAREGSFRACPESIAPVEREVYVVERKVSAYH